MPAFRYYTINLNDIRIFQDYTRKLPLLSINILFFPLVQYFRIASNTKKEKAKASTKTEMRQRDRIVRVVCARFRVDFSDGPTQLQSDPTTKQKATQGKWDGLSARIRQFRKAESDEGSESETAPQRDNFNSRLQLVRRRESEYLPSWQQFRQEDGYDLM